MNTSQTLRQNSINPSNKYSINKEKEKSVPAEFKSTGRKGEDNRINTELVNSQKFHNNRLADEQFRQLLQALVDKLITNIQPSIFTGAEEKDILSQLNNFTSTMASKDSNVQNYMF